MGHHIYSLPFHKKITLSCGSGSTELEELILTWLMCDMIKLIRFLKFLSKEYQQTNIYRLPPNYSPMSSQMMHHTQPALWGYNLVSQPQQPSFFLQNQSLNAGGYEIGNAARPF